MSAPSLDAEQVEAAIRDVQITGPSLKGGQKQVFPCLIGDERYALKLLATEGPQRIGDDLSLSDGPVDEVLARAKREISIMEKCDSPHLVKLGPLALDTIEVDGAPYIYFTEEWIDGDSVAALLRGGSTLPFDETCRLGKDVCRAVASLWELNKVHRDIKPGNIMRRSSTNEFVLLDLGLAFDLDDLSISATGFVHGTLKYFSPEQWDFRKRRSLDFRSDLFSLGVVLYEAVAGRHPFHEPGMDSAYLMAAIVRDPAPPIADFRDDVPEVLGDVVHRLLAKRPHLRFRSCDDLLEMLEQVA